MGSKNIWRDDIVDSQVTKITRDILPHRVFLRLCQNPAMTKRLVSVLRVVLLSSALLAVVEACGANEPPAHSPRAEQTYSTKGLIKSFGPDRKFVNIQHDDIPGYMNAMTMSFEPKSPEQLAGLSVNDRVVFTFISTDDGRRIISTISKE